MKLKKKTDAIKLHLCRIERYKILLLIYMFQFTVCCTPFGVTKRTKECLKRHNTLEMLHVQQSQFCIILFH